MPYANFPNKYPLLSNIWEWKLGIYHCSLMPLPHELYLSVRMQKVVRETLLTFPI